MSKMARRTVVSGCLALVALAAVLAVRRTPFAPAPVPDTLPSKLEDSEFWRLVTGFSEPDGYFRSDNFLSNESGYQLLIPTLKQMVRSGGVYLGVGPEQNFTYIAAFEPKIAFIVDIRRGNLLEHLLYKAFMEL